MSNSKLVDYVKISPNSNNPRGNKIKKITIHHVAGDLSIEKIGDIFASKSRKASANYGIGTDGRVGMYVEEKNRAWTSGNRDNDHQAITIEVANDKIGGNWHVSDKALDKLIELCIDICKRNGIKELNYTGDKKGNLTRHNMFQATTCPGPYLQSKFPYIANEVNKALKPKPKPQPKSKIAVDGYWGPETTKALQKALGTVQDGYLSNQSKNSITSTLTGGVEFGKGGSMVIKTLQKKIGAKVDGYLGPETIRKLQKYLGTIQDGKLSKPSMVVKEMQKQLNQGTF
jgi:hypothetical protein